MPNHNTSLSIYQMVLNRLTVLEDSPENTTLLSNFTLEYMYSLEPCFQVATAKGTIAEDLTRIGDEDYYSIPQKSVIADLLAVMILTRNAATNSVVTGGGAATGTTFLKKAKAGEAEVEYEQFKIKDGLSWYLNPESLINRYKKAAINTAALMGCVVDICDDCSVSLVNSNGNAAPFIVASSSFKTPGCGCT